VTNPRLPKPEHLGPEYGKQFCDESIARAYIQRPTHPPETFAFLLTLMTGATRQVLDLGCGTGIVARELAPRVDHVDAVDFSRAMIEQGLRLPNGNHPRLKWICAPAESFTSPEPYDLITCGDAIHWFEWDIVFPKLHAMLKPGASLALLGVESEPSRAIDLSPLIRRYSTNQKFAPYSLLDELTTRGHFTILGEKIIRSEHYLQSIDDFIESIHARKGFSRQRMSPASAKQFDDGVRKIVEQAYPSGGIELQAISTITWGRPT
jgi:SAM-dependent methyltransferase